MKNIVVPSWEVSDSPCACWEPRVDIYRAPRGWVVKVDLAGVRPEDVQIAAHLQRITVRGTRRDYQVVEGQSVYSMEIAYNRFERVIELPSATEQCAIESRYQDGMLLIIIRDEKAE